MTNAVYLVGGGKGGVGKSTFSIGLIDTLQANKQGVHLIETDTSNPDVYKMHSKEIGADLVDLDDAGGWIDLVNICDKHRDVAIVVNTGARNDRGIAMYSDTLSSTLDELQRHLVTLWIINRQRDSLELLNRYMDAVPASRIHVVRNGYYGDEHKFELYNDSKLRAQVEAAGGLSLLLPDLADRVSDDLYSKRLSISAAMQTLPIGNRAELARWRREVHKTLSPVLNG